MPNLTHTRAWRRVVPFLALLAVLRWERSAMAEVKLDFWHSYNHPSGVVHHSFQIASYKRGIFFGSCGPSARSLQWEYDIDLAGKGPEYQKDQIAVTSEGKKIEVVSGTITVGPKASEATIRLHVNINGTETEFVGNGTHAIKKLKGVF